MAPPRPPSSHSGAVSCAQLDDVRIVSGGFDRNLNVWDPDLGSCVSVLTGHADAVTALQFWDFGLAVRSLPLVCLLFEFV